MTVLVRPEAIRIREGGDGLAGSVSKVSYLGSSADYTVETELGSILVTDFAVAERVLAAGSAVRLQFLPHGVHPLNAE